MQIEQIVHLFGGEPTDRLSLQVASHSTALLRHFVSILYKWTIGRLFKSIIKTNREGVPQNLLEHHCLPLHSQ
jgi:hypothetical protein